MREGDGRYRDGLGDRSARMFGSDSASLNGSSFHGIDGVEDCS